MQDMRVATVQFQHVPGDKAANLEIVFDFVRKAAAEGVELVVFPECCISGYWHLRHLSRGELMELAEVVPEGEVVQQVVAWSREFQISIGVGFVERSEERLFNSYVVVMPDGQVQCHRKLHCFISAHLESGDEYTVFDLPNGTRVGVLICYDNNLVENVRACALQGAEVLIAPHQTGGCRSGSPFAMGTIQPELWKRRHDEPAAIEAEFRGDKGRGWLLRWLPARAHDNGLFLIFSNGVGIDDDEVRTGNAMILDPYGRIICETWAPRNEMLVADLVAELRERCTGVRWLRARRPELYHGLVQKTGQEKPTREVRFDST
jgi:predicted amidohydrolase